MVAITYDFIKKLEQARFTPAQVEVLSSFTNNAANRLEIIQVEKDLTEKINHSENKLEKRIDKLEKQMDSRFEKIDNRLDKLDHRFEKLDHRFEKIDNRFDKLYSSLKWAVSLSVTLIPAIIIFAGWLFHLSQ